MANGNEIERLTVSIEADIKPLLDDTKKGVDQVEESLEDVEDSAQKVERRFGKLRQAALRAGAASKRAFDALKNAAGAAGIAIAAVVAATIAIFEAAEQGLSSIRVQRSFENLANSVGESGSRIVEAMQRASGGTVKETELMSLANLGMQLNVAKTAEEFGKLTKFSILLGRALGTGPTQAMDEFIRASGRQSKLILDNLGISAKEVTTEMNRFADVNFGKTVEELDEGQRATAFMSAAMVVAARRAGPLADGIEDIGSNLERAQVAVSAWRKDFNEASFVVADRLSEIALAMSRTFFGPDGVFPLFAQGGNLVADVFANILSGFLATAATIAQQVRAVQRVFEGELSIQELFSPSRVADEFSTAFDQALNKIKADFGEVFDLETTPGITPIGGPEAVEDSKELSDELRQILLDSQTELLDLQDKTAESLLENAAEFEEKRIELAERTAQRLEKLAEQTAQARADAIRDARQELVDLERETDQSLEQERDDFQTEELRDTEDHIEDMRRLRSSHIDDLESAVASRDAGRIVDLQRQFAREKQEREQDFTTTQGREQQDFDQRLEQIRQHERDRATEIERGLQQELNRITVNEQRKRAEIERSHQERLAAEQKSFDERQAQLENSLSERLSAIAKSLANEADVTEEGAAQVLTTLAQFFGKGGEIDQLLNDFSTRRRQRMVIEVDFEGGSAPTGRRDVGAINPRVPFSRGGQPAIQFQGGGALIARRPTLFEAGEAGSELITATPLNQIRSMQPNQTQRMEIDLNLSGSAPPGIRSADRDAIAGVLVNAFREAGITRN